MELTREQIRQKLQENHSYLSSKYGLKRIGIFGSYANGTQVESSETSFERESCDLRSQMRSRILAPLRLGFFLFFGELEVARADHTGVAVLDLNIHRRQLRRAVQLAARRRT